MCVSYPLSSCVVCSGDTESRGNAEGGVMGSVSSDEANNWGMDDSIDVNAVRILGRKLYYINGIMDRHVFRQENTNHVLVQQEADPHERCHRHPEHASAGDAVTNIRA